MARANKSRAHLALFMSMVGALLMLQACSGGGGGNSSALPPTHAPPGIAQIAVTGQPLKVFDHATDQQEPDNTPDAQISAWREADGTVNLMIPDTEAYRMRGPDLLHLTIDKNKIFSSDAAAHEIPEDDYNYQHWFMGPYSLDGIHFYTLSHSEWYACLLNDDCSQTPANGGDAEGNSRTNTPNSFVSADGGASWNLNTVNGNHAAAITSYHWTGTPALTQKIYLQAANHTGMIQPTRLVQEGSYWYSVGFYLHRDFSQINAAQGVYEAPVDKSGYVLMRTSDFTNPNGWQAWSEDNTFEPIANQNFQVFSPQQGGTAINAAPAQLVYDTTAQVYLLVFTPFGGSNAVYYTTTTSLANPMWSDAQVIAGTAQLISDPGGPLQDGSGTYGPVMGFNDANYISILDAQSPGYNFEFTSGSPLLFFSTLPSLYGGVNNARDVYRVQLSVTYK